MRLIIFTIFLTLSGFLHGVETIKTEQTQQENLTADIAQPLITIKTNHGDMVLELYPEKAPITVANFLGYIEQGFYKGTIFHRVIKNFMIQGGGFTQNMMRKSPGVEIKNEADNGLFNNRGSIAMARTAKVNSATSQFFINVKSNYFLNNGHRDFGYAVFGQVIEGLEIMDLISLVDTARKQGMADVPLEAVIIEDMIVSYK